MKTLIIVFTSLAFLLVASPTMADDKQQRSGGVKTEKRAHNSSRANDRGGQRRQTTRNNSQRRDNQGSDSRRARSNSGSRSGYAGQNRRSQRYQPNRHNGNYRHNRHNYRNYTYSRHHKYNHYRSYRHGHHDSRYGYLLGGVVLGSLLSNHHYNDYPQRSRVVVTRVVRDGSYGKLDDIHLFRDRYGDCFEVHRNKYGDEVRTEIDPEYCDW